MHYMSVSQERVTAGIAPRTHRAGPTPMDARRARGPQRRQPPPARPDRARRGEPESRHPAQARRRARRHADRARLRGAGGRAGRSRRAQDAMTLWSTPAGSSARLLVSHAAHRAVVVDPRTRRSTHQRPAPPRIARAAHRPDRHRRAGCRRPPRRGTRWRQRLVRRDIPHAYANPAATTATFTLVVLDPRDRRTHQPALIGLLRYPSASSLSQPGLLLSRASGTGGIARSVQSRVPFPMRAALFRTWSGIVPLAR